MKTLVLGAGAIGGYFGGRLLGAGREVTFLVRPERQAALRATGLHILSPLGDLELPDPPAVTAAGVDGPYDVILLTCKAYDLDGALDAIAPAVGDGTLILPLLNGMRHLDVLRQRFGTGKVLGGHCTISVALDPEGRILHFPGLGGQPLLGFGEVDGGITPRVETLARELVAGGFQARAGDEVLQEMWEKWVFLATGAGITCLMRGAVGDVVEAGGADLSRALWEETSAIAAACGHAPRPEVSERFEPIFSEPGSLFTASMLRDVERGKRVEADHILGDLLARAPEPAPRSLLRLAYVHLKTYEARRARELGTG